MKREKIYLVNLKGFSRRSNFPPKNSRKIYISDAVKSCFAMETSNNCIPVKHV